MHNRHMQAGSAYLSALTAVKSFKETEGGTSKHELLQFVEEVHVGELL